MPFSLEMEKKTHEVLYEQGLLPRYDVFDDYIVEEFWNVRPTSIIELVNPWVLVKCTEAICNFNFNPELIAHCKKVQPGINARDAFFGDGDMGFYKKAKKFITDIDLSKVKNQMSLDLFTELREMVTGDEIFKKWYYDISPKADREMDWCVTHHDIHEYNFLYCPSDISKIYLIDFEYVSMNVRGFDIATLFNEVMTFHDQYGGEDTAVKIYYDFEMPNHLFQLMLDTYLKTYHKRFYKGELSEEQFVKEEMPIFRD